MANFKYIEKITTSMDLLTDLKAALTFPAYDFNVGAAETEEMNAWEMVKEDVDTTSGKIKELVMETTAKIGPTGTKVFQVKFTNSCFTTVNEHSSLTAQVLEGFNPVDSTSTEAGPPVNFEWAKEDVTPKTDRDKTKPVYLYINVMNNRLAMVIVGDPAVNFDDYRKSFLYVGATKPFKYNENDDINGNVLLTAGAVVAEPALTTNPPEYNFGQYTSNGNNSFQILRTKSGIKFQKHYPSFITQAPAPGKAYIDVPLGDTGLKLEPQGFNASAWTRKYHLSPIYIVHAYDGYRGQLDGVISVSKNNILHLDELIVDIPEGTAGKTWKQEVYRYYDTNSEQNFMNYSANVKMGLAVLKEVRY